MFLIVLRICALALTHHFINLFESQASCLRHKEVGPEDTAAAKSAPDEEYLRSEVAVRWVYHVGHDNTCIRN